MTKRKRSLRMADGGVLLPQRPVSPFSLRGIGQGLAGAYDGAVAATSQGIEAVTKPFSRPPGYTPALTTAAPAPVAAPLVPAAAAPQLGGMNLGVIQRREAAAGLRDGTAFLEGPGGPTDDKIDAKLSRGEAVLPADTVQQLGPDNIQAVIDATHTPVKKKGLRHFANGIAGIDVMETPFTREDARLFGRTPAGAAPAPQPRVPGMQVTYPVTDAGPGNPNVGRPMPPSAPTAPVATAQPAPVATAKPGGLRGFMSGGSGNVVDAFKSVGGAVGNVAKTAVRGSAAFAAPVAAFTGLNTDTEQYAKRFGMEDTEPGVMRDLGVRALGVASDVGDAMTFGQAGRFFRDKQGALAAAPAPAPAPTTAPMTAPAVAPVAAPAQPVAAATVPQQPVGQTGTIQRQGNSFSNTGEFLPTGGPQPTAQNMAAMDRIAARSTAGLRGGMDEGAPGGASIIGGEDRALAARNASVTSTLQRVSPRTQVQREQIAAQREMAEMRDATDRRGQDVQAASTSGNQRVALRGQDLSYDAQTRGQDMTARSAAASARLDQMNKDRQFQLDTAKFGQERAKTNFDQRQRGQDSVREQITAMIPNGPDGKPDTQTSARYAAALNASVANFQSALERQAAGGDQKAAATLQRFQEQGMAALDPKDIRHFINGMKAKDIAEAGHTSSWNPFGGSAVISDEPVMSLRKTGDGFLGFGGEYTSNRGDKIPARNIEGDGSFFGGQRRIDLRELVR